MFDWSSAQILEEEEEEDFIPLEEELEEKRQELEEQKEEQEFDWASATVQGSSPRDEIMAELDDDPDTRMLAYQMLDTEGGGVATMEALVNRTAMIRQKVPDWKISDELNSGFYGPINRGVAQSRQLDPKTMARYQQDIDEVRAGSNLIQGRTDQGSGRDPNVGGPGRVHIPDNPNEVYNYWTGRRNGVDFSHEDSAAFAAQLEDTSRPSTTRTAKAGEKYREFDWASAKPVEEAQVAEFDWASAKPVEPGQLKQEIGGTPQNVRGQKNREELLHAIEQAEKAGYKVPHFIGTENEPEGDRAPTIDQENLVAALKKQEADQRKAGNKFIADGITKDISYWENKIKTEGMSAEQWKKQTGENEPAFQAKQSPEELIEHVGTAIEAAKGTWETAKAAGGQLKKGVMSAGLGLGETVNRYAFSPIVHGIREAIDYIAPDSDLAKHAKTFDDAFYKSTVQNPAYWRRKFQEEAIKGGAASEVAFTTGQIIGDLPTIMLSSGILPELKTGIQWVNAMRHGAAAMTVPAMRAGADAAEESKKNGGDALQQLGAFTKATLISMGMGSVPMATTSGAPSMAGRFVERAAKSVPLASATAEGARLTENLLSSLTGGEQRPFSLEENIKATIPMALLGGVAGRDTRPSKFERTYGFNERNLEKAEWMRKQMEAEGIAKATPEKVMEWEAKWKEQEGQWPEEAEPKTSAAPQNIAQVGQGGKAIVSNMYDMLFKKLSKGDLTELGKPSKILHEANVAYQAGKIKSPEDFQKWANTESSLAGPQPVKKSPQALGIVASPKIPEPLPAKTELQSKIEAAILRAEDQLQDSMIRGVERNITRDRLELESLKDHLARATAAQIKKSRQALGIVASPKATKGFEQAKEEAKNIADFLNKTHWTPFNSAIGGLSAGRQKIQDDLRKQDVALKTLVPDKEARKGATMYKEANGDIAKLAGWGANTTHAEGREAYRQAGALSDNARKLVDVVGQRLNALLMEANARGIDVAERENYITHLLQRTDPRTGTPTRGISSYFKYSKPRTYDTLFQAMKAGEKPKTLDIVDILNVYESTLRNAIENKKFIDRLKMSQASDGRPILAPSKVRITDKDWKKIDAPGLERLVVHPEHYDHLRKILSRSKIDEWLEERSRNPFVEWGKGLTKIAMEAQKYAKGTMFSFSFFHQLTEGTHAVGHRVNPFSLKTKKIDLSDPEQYDAAKHGVMLRPDKVSQEQFMQGVGADSYNLVTKMSRKYGGAAGEKLADLIDGYSHYLFEDYIPRLKMDTYRHIVERNTARYKNDLKSGKISMAEVKSLSADQANAAYGHLNYTKMGRSATVQHLLQLAFLAPDFFEARARFAGQAVKGLGGFKTGTEQLQALAVLGIGQYVAARILNQVDHGDAEWDPEHAFQVKTDLGGILPDKRWVGLRSVPEDIHKAATDPGQFFRNRLSPFANLAGDNIFKTNWRHEKTDFAKSLTDMLSNIVPLPAQGLSEKFFRPDRAQNISAFETFLKSTGVQIHRVSPINDAFGLAEEWNRKNDPETYERNKASVYPASKYRKLRYALEDSDMEGAQAEAEKLGEGGKVGENFQQSTLRPFTGSSAHDQVMYEELNEHDKKIFDAAIERRLMILDRYREWVGPTGKTRVTEATLHKKMREAKLREMKEALKVAR